MKYFLAISSIIQKYNINQDIFKYIYDIYLNNNSNIIIDYWYKYLYKTNILPTRLILEINHHNIFSYKTLCNIRYINKNLQFKNANKEWWREKIQNILDIFFNNVELFIPLHRKFNIEEVDEDEATREYNGEHFAVISNKIGLKLVKEMHDNLLLMFNYVMF
tara:strand:+ start:4434 stop:4919 length:486 start_codon:yes stop_codon:yes gene_type:complete